MLDISHLPTVDIGTVHCLNLLRQFTGAKSLPLNEEGAEFQIKIRDEESPTTSSELFSIVFFAPLGTFGLTVDAACVDALCDHFLEGWREEDSEKLPNEWRMVYAFEQIIDRSPFAGVPCHIIDVVQQSGFVKQPSALSLTLELDGQTFPASMSVVAGVADELAKYLPFPSADMTDIGDVVVKLDATVFGPETKYEDAHKLAVGDVLILPGSQGGAFPVKLTAMGHPGITGMCDEDSNFSMLTKGS